MTIENELLKFLNENIAESENKIRDINLIHYYYGFREDIEPTLEEAAIKYDVGETDSRRTERPRQILKHNFKDIVNPNDLPSAVKFAELLDDNKVISSARISEHLQQLGLVNSEANLVGLLRIVQHLNLAKDYEIYTPKLQKATKKTYLSSNNLFLIKVNKLSELRNALRKAKTLPGLRGIASISSLKNEFGEDFQYFDEIVEILKADADSWFYEQDDETYYLIEMRDATLVNSMAKVRNILDTVDLKKFTKTLWKSLDRIKKSERPPNEILEEYLKTSKYTILMGDSIKLNLQPKELTPIEKDVVALLEATAIMDSTSISENLQKKGHGKVSIQKNVFVSPLVYKDESGGRRNYTYSLVGKSLLENQLDNNIDRYAEFVLKLKNISIEGTDREQSINARLEQNILREWLFGEKDAENCAICGEEFSITSLIAAHKKRRAECSENERINPYIVMPLCLFGCDCMYERRYLRVQDRKIVKGSLPDNLTEKENSFIESMIGKSIDARWLEGEASYFR